MIFDLESAIKVSGNALKNVSYEVVRVCNRRNLHINQDLITFFVLMYALDVKSQISFTDKLDREKLDAFVFMCVDKMADEQSPFMKATLLNFNMCNNNFDKPNTVKLIDILPENLLVKTKQLLREINNFELTSNDEYEKLLKKLMVYVFIENRFGNTQNTAMLSETFTAIKSVMKPKDLLEFTDMKKSVKLETLTELKNVICGIMMYNKYKGNAGETMRDIVADVNQGYSKTYTRLSWVLHKLSTKAMDFSKLAKRLFYFKNSKMFYYYPERESTYEYLKNVLQLYNQHEYYVYFLLQTLRKIRGDIDEYLNELYEAYKNIYEVVQYRIAVPTDIVFPYFIKLSEIWQVLWDYLYLMVEINKFNDHMINIATMPNHTDIIAKIKSLTPRKLINEPEDIERVRIDFTNSLCELLPAYKLELSIQQKFCTFYFISGNGWLIPAELHLGILKYNNRYYAFSKKRYIEEFLSNPNYYEKRYLDTLESNVNLIMLFYMYEDIKHFHIKKIATTVVVKSDSDKTKYLSVEIQTELHPIPQYKPHNYTWNIWDLRRKAVKLANLKKLKTHSAQTNISYHRYSLGCQTIKSKEQNDQTMQNKTTSLRCYNNNFF